MHGVYASNSLQPDESVIAAFVERMQKNGVDDIGGIDIVFFACVILLGLEFVNFLVKKYDRKYPL